MPGIDHLADEAIWSESVYLDAVAPDGRTGMVARLCRYPTAGTAWVWGHVFTPDGSVSFNDSHDACSTDRVAVEEPDAAYIAADGAVSFRREGPREGITRGVLAMKVDAHAGSTAPDRPGALALSINAEFEPLGTLPGAGTLPGRTEEHGTVRVSAVWPRGGLELEALGQWHEQHQDAPRFRQPFTYLTVRGPEVTLVAIIGARGGRGILRRRSGGQRATSVRVGPPADERAVAVELDDGSTIIGALVTRQRYEVPIYGRPRPGTLVSGELDGVAVSGCVNDWEPA